MRPGRQRFALVGDQDVWHVHTHVVPRYDGDGLNRDLGRFRLAPEAERRRYAERLRGHFAAQG